MRIPDSQDPPDTYSARGCRGTFRGGSQTVKILCQGVQRDFTRRIPWPDSPSTAFPPPPPQSRLLSGLYTVGNLGHGRDVEHGSLHGERLVGFPQQAFICGLARPVINASATFSSVQSTTSRHVHALVYWQVAAWPRSRAPKALTLSSLSCDMLCSLSRATVGFSTLTASVLIAFIMLSRGFLDRATPPLFRWIPLQSSESQHSRSCIT